MRGVFCCCISRTHVGCLLPHDSSDSCRETEQMKKKKKMKKRVDLQQLERCSLDWTLFLPSRGGACETCVIPLPRWPLGGHKKWKYVPMYPRVPSSTVKEYPYPLSLLRVAPKSF